MGERVVGSAPLAVPQGAYILNVVTHEDYRGQGVATALMLVAIRRALHVWGARSLYTHVEADNEVRVCPEAATGPCEGVLPCGETKVGWCRCAHLVQVAYRLYTRCGFREHSEQSKFQNATSLGAHMGFLSVCMRRLPS